MAEVKVKLKKFSKNPAEVVEFINDKNKKVDVGQFYNLIFSIGYNIDYTNIDRFYEDEMWQACMLYGFNLMLLYPTTPHANIIPYFLKNHYNDIFGKELEGSVFDTFKDINDDEQVNELITKMFNVLVEKSDSDEKFIMFKMLIDLVGLIASSIINYALADKDMDERIKSKIINPDQTVH